MIQTLQLSAGAVPIATLRAIAQAPCALQFADNDWERIAGSADALTRRLGEGKPIYGVNTGFGKFSQKRIDDASLDELQLNLVLSHCTGSGPLLDDSVMRLVLALKAIGLARGHSAVRDSIVRSLLALLAAQAYPCVPAKGSVGASGDLTPLAHMSAVLIGRGTARVDGKTVAGEAALTAAGIKPLRLGPKEGLALLNGTQVTTALALSGLFAAENVFAAAIVTGMLSLEACKGISTPFDPRIHAARGHRGQMDVAAAYRRLLDGSGIWASHRNEHRVQDPYSLRCQPQVMGACLDLIRNAATTLTIEANAVSDNPIVFADTGEILSGGNFHAEPVGFAADTLALAIAEIGGMSERRTALLMDSTLSGLPAFLTDNPGLNSGFMVAQISAAALASENKCLSHPGTVDSIPTAAGQEDHVSMATYAARRLGEMASNAAGIVAIELLAACQGLDYLAPLKPSPVLLKAHEAVRAKVPHLDRDREFAPDIAAATRLIESGFFRDLVPELTLG
ncbi:MAG: histidine ammonia-lyase [Alphaproteobacteria bacterium]|nr:histidine ammonia-lyase [Alphaproteobacteria bacterium]